MSLPFGFGGNIGGLIWIKQFIGVNTIVSFGKDQYVVLKRKCLVADLALTKRRDVRGASKRVIPQGIHSRNWERLFAPHKHCPAKVHQCLELSS
jgi:hypothetical protein